MKTLIVLCSLATIAIALPTPPLENVDGIESSLENDKRNNLREKKSVLQYTTQELPLENGMENTQTRHSLKTSSSGKTKAGNKKPIIIKKKFGYHVYRDSDEEMAHADPDEKCRKQFKVKLCDDEFSLHSSSNKPKSVLLDDSQEIISDKEMGISLKMAKEAVEKLERGLKQMEHKSPKKSDSVDNFESSTTLTQDIEMAKSALDDIQKSMGNLESIEFQLNDPETKNLKSMNQWKEAIDNIYRNVETAKNIEDAFNKQDLHNSEIINTPKTNQDEYTAQPSTLSQTVFKDNNIDLSHDMKLKTSSTNNEQNVNLDNDLFVSPTDQKDSIMKLHSDSLTKDNIFDKKALDDDNMKVLNLNTNDHLLKKSSEVISQGSELKNEKTTSIQELNAKPTDSVTTKLKETDDKNEDCGSGGENNALNKIKKENKVNSLASADKNTESVAFKEESHIGSTVDTKLKNNEHLGQKSLNTDNFSSKITLINENEAKSDDQINPTNFDFTNSKMHPRENVINNENSDLTQNTIKSQVPQVNHQNFKISSLTADGPKEEQYISNEFSNTRLADNQNTNHLNNENHETNDFHLKHLTEEKDHSSSRMNKDLKMEEQLNDFHESFMRLAQEKQMNDILMHQYRNAELIQAQMHQNHNIGSHLHENRNSHDFSSMYQLTPNNIIPTDDSAHHFKNALEFNNDYMVSTISKINGLRNDETSLSALSSMRRAENQINENMGHEMVENQNIKDPLLAERWVQEKQRKDFHGFKAASELQNDFVTPHKTNDFHSEHYAHKEQTHMRIPEDQSLRQLFTDSNEIHDPHSMRWAQEKQNGYDLPQMFDHEHELYNEPQLNAHLHELMPTNRFNSHFDLDNNHNGYTMKSRMPDHFHIVQHAKSSDMDSAMAPSMHIPMRESNMQLGHLHNHHGMVRTSYAPSQSSIGSSSGAVGVFSTANTGSGCGIPLLVSCSPSIVSGNLSRGQPIGTSASAYRTGDNLMYYRKRDANKIEGKQNVKIQTAQIPPTQ